jgi:hypothetical protein
MFTLLNDPEYQYLKKKLSEPNIFLFLQNASYEIRHSNFIKWILDPLESHGLGDYLLVQFLERVGCKSFSKKNEISIVREKWGIDILIKSSDSVLIIENKTKTKDFEGQLGKYRSIIEKNFPNHNRHYVYLTLKGENPIDSNERSFWINYSYLDLVDLLDQVVESINHSKIQMYIRDYTDAIKITMLEENSYVSTAKSLIIKHHNELNNIFIGKTYLENDNVKTIEFLRNKSSFVKGKGFFSDNKPYLIFFEESSRFNEYIVMPRGSKQSTYFSFLPDEFKSIILFQDFYNLPFSFFLRFHEKNKILKLSFGIKPETENNSYIRQKILSSVFIFHASGLGLPVKARGIKHIGILTKNIPFNPMDFDKDKIGYHVCNIFNDYIKEFVTETSKIIKQVISCH